MLDAPMTKSARPTRSQRKTAPPQDHFLYGIHAVAAALGNPRRKVHRLVATENAVNRLTAAGSAIALPVETRSARDITAIAGRDAVHQGALLYCDLLPDPDFADIADPKLIVVLDQVTDPHNVGAILRSAAAFGADGLVMTARHSPAETAVLAKTASGGLEHVPVYRVRNLADALDGLKARGILVVGLDEAGAAPLDACGLARPCAIVLGAEGKGLRQKTAATCDRLAHLTTPGAITSLNVSNAAALALYIASRS